MSTENKDDSTIHQLMSAGFSMDQARDAINLSVNQNVIKQYKCICNKQLTKITVSGMVYGTQADLVLRCDICRKPATKNDTFWHCEPNEIHKNGFDVCHRCSQTYDSGSVDKSKTVITSVLADLFHHTECIVKFNSDSDESNQPKIISRQPVDHRLYVVSKTGKSLIVCVSSDEEIDLKSITIYALDETLPYLASKASAPKQIDIYIVQQPYIKPGKYLIQSFQEPREVYYNDPDLSINGVGPIILIDNISETIKAFSAVQCFAICFKSNQLDTSKTFINAIKLESTQKQCNIDHRIMVQTTTISDYNYAKEIMKILSSVTESDSNNITEEDQIQKHFSNLSQKATKLLKKIFNNILTKPSEDKYHNVNSNKLQNKLQNSEPLFSLLRLAGFKETNNGSRLTWNNTQDNFLLLRQINTKLLEQMNQISTTVQYVHFENPLQDERKNPERRQQIKSRLEVNKKLHHAMTNLMSLFTMEQEQKDTKSDIEAFIEEQILSGTDAFLDNWILEHAANNIWFLSDTENQQFLKKMIVTNQSSSAQVIDKVNYKASQHLLNSIRNERNSNLKENIDEKKMDIDCKYDHELNSNNKSVSASEHVACDEMNCDHLLRMILTLTKYHKFIVRKKTNQENEVVANYQQLVYHNQQPERRLSKTYVEMNFHIDVDTHLIINDFHHLLNCHTFQFEDISSILIEQCNGNQ
eukprot:435482_1